MTAPEDVRHGQPIGGGRWPDCICRKQPCGGSTERDMRPDCREHARNPALSWHRADTCPARR